MKWFEVLKNPEVIEMALKFYKEETGCDYDLSTIEDTTTKIFEKARFHSYLHLAAMQYVEE